MAEVELEERPDRAARHDEFRRHHLDAVATVATITAGATAAAITIDSVPTISTGTAAAEITTDTVPTISTGTTGGR